MPKNDKTENKDNKLDKPEKKLSKVHIQKKKKLKRIF